MTGGVDISNLPNILLSAVRRSTSARTGSGMNLWDKTPRLVVVSFVDIIIVSVSYMVNAPVAAIEMYL